MATKHLTVNHTDKPLPSLTSLQNLIAYYMPPADRYLVERAIETAVSIHSGYFRKSGVPYIDHVLAVATILASWHAPADVVIAGLFHDVLKSRYANVPDLTALETNFGTVSIRLVRDTARLGRLGPLLSADQPDTKGDVMQQLPWVAMVLQRSPLAVVIKLADKLHNFQSLHFLSQKRQRAFANSVLRLFVPFAERLGMRRVKRELADQAFRVLQPEQYDAILAQYPLAERETTVAPFLQKIEACLAMNGVTAQVMSTPRSVYDLHLAETEKGRSLLFTETQTAVIAVADVPTCYQLLGLVHQVWLPQPGKIVDYIAAPKPNGYRALHTTTRIQPGLFQIVAIRDREMMLVADYGLTAGWQGVSASLLPHFEAWQDPPPGKITVLTPDGDLMVLPKGATPVDFAYAVHDGLGHQCIGAMVNGRQSALDHSLETGDVVHVLTGKTRVGPSVDWLDFVKTAKARQSIRRWLKAQKPENFVEKGWAILQTQLQRHKLQLPFGVASEPITAVAAKLGYKHRDDLLVAIGLQRRDPSDVVAMLLNMYEQGTLLPAKQATLSSLDNADLPQKLARCCRPEPPDEIVGYVTRQNIVTIHRADCARLRQLQPLIHADWNDVSVQYHAEIAIQCMDRPGLVRDVSQIISETGVNMTSFHAERLEGGISYVRIGLGGMPLSQQENLLAELRQISHVHRVTVRAPGTRNGPTVMSPQHGNPYTLRPVTGDSFFGRRAELRELINNLRNVNPGEAVLLWGPRRIGKTSLLLQLQQNVMNSDDYVVGFLDMQRLSGRSTTIFLRDIIRAILETNVSSKKIQPPNLSRMRRDPLGYFRSFLDNSPILKNRHLVLILDEFQLLANLTEDNVNLADINRYFRSLIQHSGGLTLIFSGGGVLDHLLAQPATSFMLEVARHQKMAFLTVQDARQLIVKPAGQMQYEEAVVNQLLALTAGHPYYLQWLCGELVAQVRREDRMLIGETDLVFLLRTWLPRQGAQYFNHLWGNAAGFDMKQQEMGKAVLTAVCRYPDDWMPFREIVAAVPAMDKEDVLDILRGLVQMDTLAQRDGAYCFQVPLVAVWMQANFVG